MEPIKIIEKYFDKNSGMYEILVKHSKHVAEKALEIAKNVPELNPDLELIYNGAMLHDIGICKTNFKPFIINSEPYVKHTVLGAEILRNEGLGREALIAERHLGVGLTKEDVIEQKLPLPIKDYMPETVEEEIVCLADNFFTKSKTKLDKELTIEEIKIKHNKIHFNNENQKEIIWERFENLCKKYKIPLE